jgi:hypothetical protein
MTEEQEKKEGFLRRFARAAGEFVYGMTSYETALFAVETRSRIEYVFLLITMGDLLGIPILRSYYSLRILPFVVPKIGNWKYRTLREKDLTDALSQG